MLRGKRSDFRGISQSEDHYLRAIRDLRAELGYARISDVATRLNVSAPTVSNMVRHLQEHKLVQRDRARFIQLTQAGERLAKGVAGRKKVILAFLIDVLGMDAAVAERDACQIEHAVSGVMIDRLIDLIKFMGDSGQESSKAHEAFSKFRRSCSAGEQTCNECEFSCEAVLSGCERIMGQKG
jgi:DtxR family transcriptional regulator, Mn-dependent transcriptional regulator